MGLGCGESGHDGVVVVVVVINYWWWLWHNSECGGGYSICKEGCCNSCRRALGMYTMCGEVTDKGSCGGRVYVDGGGGGEHEKNH